MGGSTLTGSLVKSPLGDVYQEGQKTFIENGQGEISGVPYDTAAAMMRSGEWRAATPDSVAAKRRVREDEAYREENGFTGEVLAQTEGVGRGIADAVMTIPRIGTAIIGADDLFGGASGGDVLGMISPDTAGEMKARQRAYGGEIGEFIGQALGAKGLGWAAKSAAMSVGLGRRVATALATPGVLPTIGRGALLGAAEGGLMGGAMEGSAAYKQGRKVDTDALLTQIGTGSLLGLGLGAGISGTGLAIKKGLQTAGSIGRRFAGAADESALKAVNGATTAEKASFISGKPAAAGADAFNNQARYAASRLGKTMAFGVNMPSAARTGVLGAIDLANLAVSAAKKSAPKESLLAAQKAGREFLSASRQTPKLTRAVETASKKVEALNRTLERGAEKIKKLEKEGPLVVYNKNDITELEWGKRWGKEGRLQARTRAEDAQRALDNEKYLAEVKHSRIEAELEELAASDASPMMKKAKASELQAEKDALDRKVLEADNTAKTAKSDYETSFDEGAARVKTAEAGMAATEKAAKQKHAAVIDDKRARLDDLRARLEAKQSELRAHQAALGEHSALVDSLRGSVERGADSLSGSIRAGSGKASKFFGAVESMAPGAEKTWNLSRRLQARAMADTATDDYGNDPHTDLIKAEDAGKRQLNSAVIAATTTSAPPMIPTGVGDYKNHPDAQFQRDGETRRDAYFNRQQELSELAANPELLIQKLTTSTAGIAQYDEEAASKLQMTAARAVGFLNQVMGHPEAPNIFDPNNSKGFAPATAIDQSERMWNAAMFPGVLLEELSKWNLRDETMAVAREVHPELLQEVQLKMAERLTEGWKPTYKQRLQMSSLMGVPDRSRNPGFQGRISTYLEATLAPAPQRNSTPGDTGTPTLSQQHRTLSQSSSNIGNP